MSRVQRHTLFKELAGRDNLRIQPFLREVFGIQRDDEICFPGLGTSAKRIVFRVGGKLYWSPDIQPLSFFAYQINNSADDLWAGSTATQYVFIFIQDIIGQ